MTQHPHAVRSRPIRRWGAWALGLGLAIAPSWAVGADGVPALDALPLTRITRSPGFRAHASENLQNETLTIYERI